MVTTSKPNSQPQGRFLNFSQAWKATDHILAMFPQISNPAWKPCKQQQGGFVDPIVTSASVEGQVISSDGWQNADLTWNQFTV